MNTNFSIALTDRTYNRLCEVHGIREWLMEHQVMGYWERDPERVRIYFTNERVQTLFLLMYGEYL